MVTVYFKVNGQGRNVQIKDESIKVDVVENIKIDKNDITQIGAPLQGSLYKVLVKKDQIIKENDPLFVIEAMKMETTVAAHKDGKVKSISLNEGRMVKQDDLVITLE